MDLRLTKCFLSICPVFQGLRAKLSRRRKPFLVLSSPPLPLLEIHIAVSNLMLLLCWWCVLRVIIGSVCLTELHVNTHELCNSKTEKPPFVKYLRCFFETLNGDEIVTSRLSQSPESYLLLYLFSCLNIYDFFTLFLSLPLMVIV